MFLIDEPYVSEVLSQFLCTSQAEVLANDFAVASLPATVNFVAPEQVARTLGAIEKSWIYSNSENSIAWLEDTLGKDSLIMRKINLFKDKGLFREKTAALFPEILYKKITAEEIARLRFSHIGHPFIIKPNVGFISAGVFRVDSEEDWLRIQPEILQATEQAARAFPGAVLRADAFLLESIIEGTEYAVDVYFDEENRPVILNILQHDFSSVQDMSDRLYLTSASIIRNNHASIEDFLKKLASLDDFSGMPMHVEVRIDSAGYVRPIEVNPLRFAGWCSTDIAWYAYGLNVYATFFKRSRPDWEQLLQGCEEKTFGMAVIERSRQVQENESYDYNALAALFRQLLCLREIDYRRYSLFAFIFFAMDRENDKECESLLTLDPLEYLRTL